MIRNMLKSLNLHHLLILFEVFFDSGETGLLSSSTRLQLQFATDPTEYAGCGLHHCAIYVDLLVAISYLKCKYTIIKNRKLCSNRFFITLN